MPEATMTLGGVQTPPESLRFTGNVWGIDPSTRRIALGVIQGKGREETPEVGWFCLPVEEVDKGPYRLRELRRALVPWLRRYLDAAPPAVVAVEQPFSGGGGKRDVRPHPQSYFVVGVLLEVLADTLASTEAVIETVDPMSWKRDAMGQGQGGAGKPFILAWAREHGYPGDCPGCHGRGRACDKPSQAHDEADTIAIATGTAVRWQRDGRLR